MTSHDCKNKKDNVSQTITGTLSFQVQKKIVCIGRIASVMLVLEGQSGMGNLPPTNLPHLTAKG